MRILRFILGTIVIAILSSLLAIGQATFGVISGNVTDSTGAALVGATVSVQRIEGGEIRVATSGPTGDYRVESLTPGTYRVKVTAEHFSATEMSNVQVNASVTTPVNVRLSVGSTTETVTVDASVQQVQTDNGQIDAVIPTTQIRDLPIVGGNPYSLAVTLPGVSQPDQRDNFTNGTGFSVNGLRPRSNNFLIDGFDNNDYAITGQALQPTNQEAVASVTVLQNAYAAEYGRGGGSVSNLTYKSGTNNFHGSAWEQYSGNALSATTAEEQASGLKAAPHQVNNLFGFTVGGPVIKNKLFFFGTSQWTRDIGAPNPPATTLTIPSASGIATLNQVLAGNPNNTRVQILLNSLGGLVAPSTLSSVPIADEPGCTGCSVDFGQITRTDSERSLSYEWTARGDYTASDHDQIFARFTNTYSSLSPDLFANATALPTQDTLQHGPARNFGVMWAHTFSPTVLNEFRFSAQTIAFYFDPTAKTLANAQAHLPGITFSSSFGGGVTALGGFEQATFPQGRQHETYQFQDAVSLVKGKHSMKIGADLAVLLVQDEVPFNSDGTAVFSPGGDCVINGVLGTKNCTDLANYIDDFSGPSGNVAKSFGNPRISIPTNQQGYYFQDSWKMRPNFTLDYGVRYEYQPPDASNVLAFPAIDHNISAALSADPNLRVPVQPYRKAWGPRLGFSYSPRFWQGLFGQDKTVIRAGGGVFYDTFFTNISDNTAATFPNSLGGNLFGATGGPRGLANALESIAAITPSASPTDLREPVTDNLRNPRTYQWNMNVQRELPGKLIAQAAYVGTRGTGLFANEQYNPRVPTGAIFTPGPRTNDLLGSIVVRGNRGDSIYHALQTEVIRNVGNLSLRGAYTWSRSIDNSSEVFVTCGGATRWENVRDPRSDRGPSCFNHTNVAAFTWVYALPSPSMRFLNQVLGGWETSGSIVLQSGAPENLYFGGVDVNGDGEAFNDRPTVITPSAPINASAACLNNPNCVTGIAISDPLELGPGLFDLEQLFFGAGGNGVLLPVTPNQVKYAAIAGKNGNLGRNSIVLPGLEQYNLSVLKNFKLPFGEGHQLQFRADFLNAFNHFNAGQNNIIGYGNLVNPGLGVLGPKNLTLDGGRNIQVWMKYSF